MTEFNGFFKIGGVNFPIPTGGNFLQNSDPALYYLKEYLSAVIPYYLQAAWAQQIAISGPTGYPNIVAETTVYPPQDNLGVRQYNFPFLCVYREHTQFMQRTVLWYETQCDVRILFVLPPLEPEQYETMYPFLKLVSDTILNCLWESLDSNFNSGEPVLTESGIELIEIIDSTHGMLEFQGNSQSKRKEVFPTLNMKIRVFERRNPVDLSLIGPVISGFDGYVSLDSADNSTPLEMSDFVTNSLVIDSVSPSSGTIQGNTYMVIAGAGFNNVTSVSIGQAAVLSFTIASDNMITCFTGASATGIYDVVVSSSNDSFSFTNGFTYTSP